MLEIMKLRHRFSSLLPVSSLLFIGLAALTSGSTGCGSDQACFYFTQVEYDLDNSCPSGEEALTFFQGDFCSTSITSVDSEGRFDGDTCCYDITESNDFFGCGITPDPIPPPFPGTTGVGGSGGIGGTGGTGGTGATGGGETCARCVEFLTTNDPPTLCTMSITIYEAYSDCMCNGACASVCGDTCMTQTPSPACEPCLLDAANGCGQQYQACLNDF